MPRIQKAPEHYVSNQTEKTNSLSNKSAKLFKKIGKFVKNPFRPVNHVGKDTLRSSGPLVRSIDLGKTSSLVTTQRTVLSTFQLSSRTESFQSISSNSYSEGGGYQEDKNPIGSTHFNKLLKSESKRFIKQEKLDSEIADIETRFAKLFNSDLNSSESLIVSKPRRASSKVGGATFNKVLTNDSKEYLLEKKNEVAQKNLEDRLAALTKSLS